MAKGIYDVLVEAGAPPLPATHFYRVKPLPGFRDMVEVQVRERRIWPLWSKDVGSCAAMVAGDTETEAIVWAAKHAHKEAFRGARRFAGFLGNHPW